MEELARQTENPIANLISLASQNNTDVDGATLGQRTQNAHIIQPVIPVPLGKDLPLVTRTIAPVIYQPTSASGKEAEVGPDDINPSFVLVPRTKSKITWGAALPSSCPQRHDHPPARANGALAQPVSSC